MLEQLETDRAKDLEQLQKQHSESLAQLEDRHNKESLSQIELDAQLAALKLAESESKKSIKEHYEAEMLRASEVNTSLKQQLDILSDRLHSERQQAEKQRQEREAVIQDLEKSVATGEQILKTIKEDLQKTTEDRNKFQAQHKVLLDRVTSMKSTLGTKLQADMVRVFLDSDIMSMVRLTNSILMTFPLFSSYTSRTISTRSDNRLTI